MEIANSWIEIRLFTLPASTTTGRQDYFPRDDQSVGAKVRTYSETILLKPGHDALNGAAD